MSLRKEDLQHRILKFSSKNDFLVLNFKVGKIEISF